MSSDELAGSCQLRQNLGMGSGYSEVKWNDRHSLKYTFHKGFPSQPALRRVGTGNTSEEF